MISCAMRRLFCSRDFVVLRRGLRLMPWSLGLLLGSCATIPPEQPQNLCRVFDQNPNWYREAKGAERRRGTPIHVSMAIMEKESGYRANARTKRTYLLGVIPWGHVTTAYGYAQVKDETWDWYRERTGRHGARRNDFGDAVDFIAWHATEANRTLGIPLGDAYRQYLAYHEGLGGYRRGTYRSQSWLLRRAEAVRSESLLYARQIKSCEAKFTRGWLWWLWPF